MHLNEGDMVWNKCLLSLGMLAVWTLPAVGAEAPCLKYEPQVVELKGTLKQVVFPGPPHFRSIQKGDTPETYWVLALAQEMCVEGDPADELNTETEDSIRSFQLILDNYDTYRKLVGKSTVVKGTLLHAFTGHHHTPVLLNVETIRKDLNKKVVRAR
jgi:Domain of unknown function (DUF4431)